MFVQHVCVYICNCVNCRRENLGFFLVSPQDFAVFSFTQLLSDTLRELDLTLCVHVTDLSVRCIATYLHKLVVLRLGWCKEVTDWGLLGIVERAKCDPDQEMVRPTDTGGYREVGNSFKTLLKQSQSGCININVSTGRQRSKIHPHIRKHGLLQASSFAV